MQSKPISDLPEATSVAAGDTAVIVQDGVTKKVTAERLAGGGAALYATAAQGAKADTAQQPPSEGAFVNGDKTKLDGIEAGADVTDTTNVTAAGALMDSEVTNLAAVKTFDPTDYATAAQGATADSAVQPGDNANTLGSGAATDGFVLKADGAGGAVWEEAGGYPDFTGNAGKALKVNGAADGVLWGSVASLLASIRDEKAAGTNGGASTTDTYLTRDLNTVEYDPQSIITLSSNTFESSVDCTITWSASARRSLEHKTRLVRVSDAAVISDGTSEYTSSTIDAATRSIGVCPIVAGVAYRIEHRVGAGNASGFGLAADMGEPEVYTIVNFWGA